MILKSGVDIVHNIALVTCKSYRILVTTLPDKTQPFITYQLFKCRQVVLLLLLLSDLLPLELPHAVVHVLPLHLLEDVLNLMILKLLARR